MFDDFEVRSFLVTTFTTFEIHCDYNSNFFTDVIEEEREKRKINQIKYIFLERYNR